MQCGIWVTCSIKPSPTKEEPVTEAATALPACGGAPQVAVSAVRLRLVLLCVPEGAHSFYHLL